MSQTDARWTETDVPARLDRLPWSRWHWLVVVALGITWVLDGLEVTLAGSVAGVLKDKASLGFTDAEMTAYVSRENVFLTLFGIALGLVLGKYLHQWLVLTVEIDIAMFGRTAKPMSYVYSVVLTVLFSVLVNLAAHRKMKKIDMVESLKTVE